ncbi:ras GTPase-activating protein raskol-like isoform X3 [Scylla paramamosain]|uniref:ras GTPase-activating protein raskol-like isoform X3 n=1 Tax=Scylla paramamosain TaxID=85552 RepID=UPI0030832FEB
MNLHSWVTLKVTVRGAVARVTHGSQGSAPPSPQLSSSRSADSTPKKNILQRIKMGARNASKNTKGIKTNRGPDSCVEGGGGEDGMSRSHSHDNLYPGHAPSPQQSRSKALENQDETRRTENTLKIWIMEAKEIPSKKKYFCHLIVNLQPSHRTCSKPMTNMCFWGEYFELDLSPEITSIIIELKREGDKKSNKKIGSVEIDLKPSSPGRATQEEQWYPVKVEKQDKTTPALRIRHRFQSLDILPLSQYGPLLQYLKENATPLCQLLEPVLPVKAKEDIATTLINIMQAENCAIAFLVDLVYTDIKTNAENEHLLFRGNSVATKAIEAYMKLVGEQYLHDTLKDPILALITSAEDLEVDPLKITNVQFLQEHRNSLKEKVTAVWEKILQSSRNFPVELREVFHKLREQLSRQEKCELTDNLISSCVFLRFFCPAVLSPYLFNMVTAYPDDRASRNLTLVAKTLQTLANFTLFQGKEKFMEFLNEFINKEQERCRAFLRAISSPPSSEDSILDFDGKIDRGKHLALLHLHLVDVLAEMNTQGYESEASRVMALVEDISVLLGGSHTRMPYVPRPSSGPILPGSPALAPPQMPASNNNFMREESTDGTEERGTGLGMTPSTNRSQSFPRSVTPVYSHHHMVTSSPRPPFHHQARSAGGDLGPSEEHVLITAFDLSSRPQISMFPSEEANNNNPPAVDMRVNNSNSYYIGEVPPPPVHQVHHQPQRALIHNTPQTRQHLRGPPSRNLSVGEVQGSADRRVYDRNCSEFFRYMDDASHKFIAACKDGENNIQGSQTSISQLSNIASSGYQSFAYSQSSSPVDSLLHTDNSSLLSRENGNPGLPVGIRQVHHDSPLASPLHQQTSKYRAVGMHPAYLGHAGHASLHGTPRHAPRVPQPKESPNSSLSSSQSVEDLSSLRRGRTRQRRSASSSSDSSPDSHPPSHSNSHFRRAPAHTPRTNPHCSPRLVPSPALRHELRSAKQRHDRSVSSRRGRSNRSSEREDLQGPPHCCDDSEDDLNVAVGSLGGAGAGGWVREGWQEHHHLLAHNLPPQQLLDQQEDQMRAIIERLMSMEQEFRHEQEMMRREMHYKDARIDAQEKKIAALDSANTHLIRTIASLNSRPGELKPDLSGDLHNDSCNASDTSDYKSSSC